MVRSAKVGITIRDAIEEGVPRGYVIDRFPKFQKSVIFRNRSKWGILSVFDPQNDVFMCFEPFLVPKIPCGAFTTAKSSIFWHSGPKMCNFVSWTSCWDRNIWFCGVMKPHTSQKSGQKCSKSENLRGWRNPTESHTSAIVYETNFSSLLTEIPQEFPLAVITTFTQ